MFYIIWFALVKLNGRNCLIWFLLDVRVECHWKCKFLNIGFLSWNISRIKTIFNSDELFVLGNYLIVWKKKTGRTLFQVWISVGKQPSTPIVYHLGSIDRSASKIDTFENKICSVVVGSLRPLAICWSWGRISEKYPKIRWKIAWKILPMTILFVKRKKTVVGNGNEETHDFPLSKRQISKKNSCLISSGKDLTAFLCCLLQAVT